MHDYEHLSAEYAKRWGIERRGEEDESEVETAFACGLIECIELVVSFLREEAEAVEKGESKIFWNRAAENPTVTATLRTIATRIENYWMRRGALNNSGMVKSASGEETLIRASIEKRI